MLSSPSIKLSSGNDMPVLGLGTYLARGEEVHNAVLHALKLGYRHIDTASIYQNEKEIASAIEKSGVPREEIFITSKAGPTQHGFDKIVAACEESLQNLQTDYLDLYLIHWPGVAKLQPSNPKNSEIRKTSWEAMEHLFKTKKCRSIGVSNYTIHHLEELFQHAKVFPSVNQFELHPLLKQNSLVEWCKSKGIVVEAYSSLGQGNLLDDPLLTKFSAKYHKTPAQILLRWAFQKGYVVIPKSVTFARIKENSEFFDFELSAEDVALIENMEGEKSKNFCWNPNVVV
eukprot:TRINITY_DN5573_c0_g2_i4.p1 TRINITY_DN5573_c0_g2~~TRINITY_DN5573_c0_g2_i4.p1  ORF type:complete len:286 (-),score=60.07 TRINITY_DN5573_c0_g2_i4:71-928(-)